MRTQRGFSLIELAVTIVVLAVLGALVVPSAVQYSANSKILGISEVFATSLQKARTEAIRRNVPVELILTDQTPNATSLETTGLTTNGPNWLIRSAAPSDPADPEATPNYGFIEARSGAEGGSGNVVISANASSIRFNALGSLVGGAPVFVDFSHSASACEPVGSTRCLRVVVSSGGQPRLCDPVVTAAADNRKC